MLSGSYAADAVASVSTPGAIPLPRLHWRRRDNATAYQLRVALPHSGHYGDDWPCVRLRIVAGKAVRESKKAT